MYDEDEEPPAPEEEPTYDWDAWERNRLTGYTRWWIILMVAITIALTIQFFQTNGQMFR